jgi:hypothetical protein
VPATIERLYVEGRYRDAMSRGESLLKRGEDARVRLFTGLGAYEAGEVSSAVTHLLAAVRAGQELRVPVVHRHERLVGRDEYCRGDLVLTQGLVEYRGSERGHAFGVAYARVAEVSLRSLSLQREPSVLRVKLDQGSGGRSFDLVVAARGAGDATPCGDCGAKAVVLERLLAALK